LKTPNQAKKAGAHTKREIYPSQMSFWRGGKFKTRERIQHTWSSDKSPGAI